MNTYHIKLQASKAGSIGTKYCEKRYYVIDASSQDAAQDAARELAYGEGLEHTLITSVREVQS